MEYLIPQDFFQINEMSIEQHGGNFNPPDNLLKSGAIEYLVEAVQSKIFGQEAYPEVHHKAGVYMFSIINNHVFSDGNKRTGLGAALLFLRINGYKLKGALLDENSSVNSNLSRQKQLEKITLLVASGRMSQEQLQKWFERNIEPIENN